MYFKIFDQKLVEQSQNDHWRSLAAPQAIAALRLFADADWQELAAVWKRRAGIWQERCAMTLGKNLDARGLPVIWELIAEGNPAVKAAALDALRSYYHYTGLELDQVRLAQLGLKDMMGPRQVLPLPWGLTVERAHEILFPNLPQEKSKSVKTSNVVELNQLPAWAQEKIKLLADDDDAKIRDIFFETRTPSLQHKSIFELFQAKTAGQFEDIVRKHLDKLIDFYRK